MVVDEGFVNECDVSGVVGQVVEVGGGPGAEASDRDEKDDEELLEDVLVTDVNAMCLAGLELGENTAKKIQECMMSPHISTLASAHGKTQ